MARWLLFILAIGTLAFVPLSCRGPRLRIGSKSFTESVIMGELLGQLASSQGIPSVHFRQLGGTRLVFDALVQGEIDAYPEYTGTLAQEIFADKTVSDYRELADLLQESGIEISRPLGFNNTYALGMKRETASQLGMARISDLSRQPELRFAFSNEFLDRSDGWPPLRRHYGLSHQNVVGVEHELAYGMLESGAVDVIDIYTTDAKIRQYDIVLLEDDRGFFPAYDAVILYRSDLMSRWPEFSQRIELLEGAIDESAMVSINSAVEHKHRTEAAVAAEFLATQFDLHVEVQEETAFNRIKRHTLAHLDLVRRSLLPAILVAVPLGIVGAKRPLFGQMLLASVGVIQTIPALALLVLLMAPVAALGLPSVGSGSLTAIVALFLYSLLPIVRNTCTGLSGIPDKYRESAEALGLPPMVRLTAIELPLASQTILAGIKTAAVLNVGFATLGALIGAGGYGQPILTGIRLNSTSLILQGAVPAAVLALIVQGLFEVGERFCVPKGLRLRSS